MDEKKEKVQPNGDKFDISRKILNAKYNNEEEMELQVKTEIEENLMDDHDNMDNHDYTNEDLPDHNSYSKETKLKPYLVAVRTSDVKPFTKIGSNWNDYQNYGKRGKLVWKDEVANSGTKDSEDKLSKADDTYWDGSKVTITDGSNVKSDDDDEWTPSTPYKKRGKKSLYEVRRNEKRKEIRLAARIAKAAAIKEEERLAQEKDLEERRQLAIIRANKRKRDKRLAAKIAKSFVCPAENCEKFFKQKDEADGHFREIHEGCTEDPYHCDHCPEKFSEYKLLCDHYQKRKINGRCIGKEECKFCGKHYITEAELNEHLLVGHTGPNPFICGFCNTEYTNSLDLRKHTDQYHPDVVKTVCDVCGETVPMSKIKAHKNKHENGKTITCEICSTSFFSANSFKVHQEGVHQIGVEKSVCEVCGKECAGKRKLMAHVARHKKLLPCRLCDRMFQSSTHLKNHEIAHTGIRNFFCNVCGKAFLTSPSLKGHELTHQVGYVPRKFNRRQKPAVRVDKPKQTDSSFEHVPTSFQPVV